MTISTRVFSRARPGAHQQTVLVLLGVSVVVIAVSALQSWFHWQGTEQDFLLVAAACATFALLSGWFFSLRGRTLGDRGDRLVGGGFLLLAAFFLVRMLLAALGLEGPGAEAVIRGGWLIANGAAALLLLSVGLLDLLETPARRRLVLLANVAAALAVAGVGVGAHGLAGIPGALDPGSFGLAALFAAAGAMPLLASLRSRNSRDLALGGALLLLGAAHGDLAWQASPYDTSFMWGHLLMVFAFAVPLIAAVRENIRLLGRQVELNRRIQLLGRRIQLLLEALPTLVLTVDEELVVQYANPAGARLFQIPAGLTKGITRATWVSSLGKSDQQLVREAIAGVFEERLPSWSGMVTVTDGDGGSHWLQVQIHPVLDPVEERHYAEIVGSDVTELLLARRAAERRQDRLALLSNAAQTVAGEREERRIVSRFAESLAGWIPVRGACLFRSNPDGSTLIATETLGDQRITWPDRLEDPEHPGWRSLRDALPTPGELPLAMGAVPPADQVLYLPLFAAGTTVGVLAVCSRVRLSPGSEEMDLFIQLGILLGGALHLAALIRELEEQRGIALQASRMKSEFLANTSHELRTPLTSILGFLRLILDDAVRDPGKQREFLRVAHESAERLLAIINDVLDLAKIEAGRLEVHPSVITSQDVLNEVQRLFIYQMRNKAVEFLVDPAPSSLVVRADPHRLRQILTNLLSNALKFTPKGGTIELKVRPDDGKVVFEVRDSGSGIPAEQLDRIFESFYQVDGSTTRSAGGTGLGLTISRRLARMMDGDLVLDSQGPGTGTTARVVLPSAPIDPV